MKYGILALLAVALVAQTVGTVTVKPGAPPQPAVATELTATSGSITCTMKGDTFPARTVTISCRVRGVEIPPEVYTPQAGDAYLFTRSLNNGDSVAVKISADSAGKITVDAAANTSPSTVAVF